MYPFEKHYKLDITLTSLFKFLLLNNKFKILF